MPKQAPLTRPPSDNRISKEAVPKQLPTAVDRLCVIPVLSKSHQTDHVETVVNGIQTLAPRCGAAPWQCRCSTAPRCLVQVPPQTLPKLSCAKTVSPDIGHQGQQFAKKPFAITQVSRTSDQLLLEVALARLLCLFCWLLVADVRGVCFGTAQFGKSLRRNLHQAPRCRAALPVQVPHRTEVPGFGCR